MEYVQTVLVQIAATKLDEASGPQGLLSELEAHRDFASAQRGFLGMRITRTANPEGNVLVVVETRWANNNAMADYSTLKNNAVAIINKHQDEILPNSLQVHRMEAVRSEAADAPNRVYDRMALALLIPAGVLAFALLVIFLLSRIYLSLPSAAATPFAAGIAVGILALSWYFASNPALPRWQLAAVAAVIVATLAVGGTAAAIYDDNNKEVKAEPTPPPVAQGSPSPNQTPPSPNAPEVDMQDNKFLTTNLTVAGAGKEVTLPIKNSGASVHNVHISLNGETGFEGASGAICKATGTDPCSKPPSILGGKTATITFTLPAGTYDFRCDFHSTEMKGKLTVQ